MHELQPKPLKYKELPGLSARQLSEHHDVLYAGYVKKVNEIRTKLKEVDLAAANATFSDLRALKIEEGFALNGVKLHEAYFDNMQDGGSEPSGDIAKLFEEDFGSYAAWKAEFLACGLAARGWVVLAYDLDQNRLFNVVCDVHNQGGVWNTIPLLVLDVYEHAYFIDYATGRKNYLEAFVKNVAWDVVNAIVAKYRLMELRS